MKKNCSFSLRTLYFLSQTILPHSHKEVEYEFTYFPYWKIIFLCHYADYNGGFHVGTVKSPGGGNHRDSVGRDGKEGEWEKRTEETILSLLWGIREGSQRVAFLCVHDSRG